MSKTLSFVRLDFITVKPYLTLKNLIIFMGLAFIMSWSTSNSGPAVGIFVAYGSLYGSTPFVVGERNGIDTLYATLSLDRKNVVLGRYIFTVCVMILSSILGTLLSCMASMVLHKAFDPAETLAVFVSTFFIFSFIQTIQLPLYFKLGYAKAKFLAYMPFLGLPLVMFLFGSFFQKSNFVPAIKELVMWIAANPIMPAVLCAAVWIFMLCVSYRVSLRFYKKRDF